MRRISFLLPKLLVLGSMCALLVGVSWSRDGGNQSDIAKRIDASAKVLDEIMAVKDKAIPDRVMRDSKCIAVIPSMIKIAVGFGGNHGKGVATCRTENGWSAPAPIILGSWERIAIRWFSACKRRNRKTSSSMRVVFPAPPGPVKPITFVWRAGFLSSAL